MSSSKRVQGYLEPEKHVEKDHLELIKVVGPDLEDLFNIVQI